MTTKGQVPNVGFEEAYREHRMALLRLAYLTSGSHEMSEDVVQSAFTSAHERWDQSTRSTEPDTPPSRSPETWTSTPLSWPSTARSSRGPRRSRMCRDLDQQATWEP